MSELLLYLFQIISNQHNFVLHSICNVHHLFHSNEFSVKRIERLAKYGSDHFALLTELVYNPDSDNQKQQEQIDKEKAVDELKMPSASKQQVPMFEK